MNVPMWAKALQVIPSVTREEWDVLDITSKWLISTRAAVLMMTFISATLAGLFALRYGKFDLITWLALTIGLILAHATNNLLNDYIDFVRGVDKDNYFRTMYGPQTVAHGLLTTQQLLTYIAVTGLSAMLFGIYLIGISDWDLLAWKLLGLGVLFVILYTWPLKYIAMGEIAVLVVWGPLMIGGGYYIFAHHWDWNVVWASLPYALGVTTVIFGKHIDKIEFDRQKKIHTLPVLLGERISRYLVIAMMILPYIMVLVLVAIKYFTLILLIVFLAFPTFLKILPAFLQPRPETRPENFPEGQGGWPLYFAPLAFKNNLSFGKLFIFGLFVDVLLYRVAPFFGR